MATRQVRKLAEQFDRDFINLRTDIRRNAAAYKRALTEGHTVEQVADVMNKDAALYLVRVAWHTTFRSNRRALYDTVLAHLGETDAEHVAEGLELRSAAVSQRDGAKTNATQINSLSDTVLAAVADHGSLWDE